MKILKYNSLDSTMLEAERYMKSHPHNRPFALVANMQTNGLGKPGRQFLSPRQTGIYLTYVTQTITDFKQINILSLSVGVVIATAIDKIYHVKVKLKWVNDLILKNKKVGGILIRIVPLSPSKISIAIGVGVNITPPIFFSKQIGGITNTYSELQKQLLIDEIITQITNMFSSISSKYWITEYRNKSFLTGKTVTLHSLNQETSGVVLGFQDDGSILIQDNYNNVHRFYTGEVKKVDWT
ncbi:MULTISPECIES: biotin--[acetyl-CoA-carboxylase] ligase [Latilactobacillus]|uniref:biotin--[acetyl-CoA-carboxylase] ligase n=1 Tax=Latilactobacillus TaxID=2767885 RepID=UPI0020307E8B|nr:MULTISPECIES: biotin--[acetyl-CoA-carboxylase] ligase [Latilactobacillus]MCM1635761.1 biotin--[acetyl-CoA-carboxylase] ligase [Latilactobacillus sakei]MCW8780382.1 biotin--[acetyl-CoA-carboxylase] ligase [Latilactobacillus curvatus]